MWPTRLEIHKHGGLKVNMISSTASESLITNSTPFQHTYWLYTLCSVWKKKILLWLFLCSDFPLHPSIFLHCFCTTKTTQNRSPTLQPHFTSQRSNGCFWTYLTWAPTARVTTQMTTVEMPQLKKPGFQAHEDCIIHGTIKEEYFPNILFCVDDIMK